MCYCHQRKWNNNNPLQVKIEGKITSEFLHGSLSPFADKENKFFLGSQAQIHFFRA